MKLYDYLKTTPESLQVYIDEGLIDTAHHPEFPLVMFTYGRKCVADQKWDSVTTKCRGLIVNEETEEIIARPFEKFFNYGETHEKAFQLFEYGNPPTVISGEPDCIVEKLDGFLCTLYEWEGVQYIASKGSFDSPHAKWATAELRKRERIKYPTSCTPVFEGICPALRIVVDYKGREELVLLGLVNRETGEEIDRAGLECVAQQNGLAVPCWFRLTTMEHVVKHTLDASVKNVEGYVLVWDRPGTTPFRLKLKYQDYCRIHRIVTGVSPKRVYEALVNGWQSELNSWLDESTPWFNKFVSKWKNVLEREYKQIEFEADKTFMLYRESAVEAAKNGEFWTRKQWAACFAEAPDYLRPILFAKLDGKDGKVLEGFIWKRVKPLIKNTRPLIDAHK